MGDANAGKLDGVGEIVNDSLDRITSFVSKSGTGCPVAGPASSNCMVSKSIPAPFTWGVKSGGSARRAVDATRLVAPPLCFAVFPLIPTDGKASNLYLRAAIVFADDLPHDVFECQTQLVDDLARNNAIASLSLIFN